MGITNETYSKEYKQLEDMYVNNQMLTMQSTASYTYLKLEEIFAYSNLPLTINKHEIESRLLTSGTAVIYKYGDEIFVTDANISDEPLAPANAPKKVKVQHYDNGETVHLDFIDGIDCVIMKNDASELGMSALVMQYSALSAQAIVTMNRNLIDLRSTHIIQAKDEDAFKSALEYEAAVSRGDGAIMLAMEMDGLAGVIVHNTPFNQGQATQTIELYNFINSQFYAEVGINMSNNMKRSYVSDEEQTKSQGIPLINHMLTTRIESILKVNALFDVEIGIRLSDDWEDEEKVIDDTVDEEGVNENDGDNELSKEEETKQSQSDSESTEEIDETNTVENEENEEHSEEIDEPLIIDSNGKKVEPITKEEVIDAAVALGGENHGDTESDNTAKATISSSRDD